jgi:hypothetical protein
VMCGRPSVLLVRGVRPTVVRDTSNAPVWSESSSARDPIRARCHRRRYSSGCLLISPTGDADLESEFDGLKFKVVDPLSVFYFFRSMVPLCAIGAIFLPVMINVGV